MYYANLAEIRSVDRYERLKRNLPKRRAEILAKIESATSELAKRKIEIEEMILGTRRSQLNLTIHPSLTRRRIFIVNG